MTDRRVLGPRRRRRRPGRRRRRARRPARRPVAAGAAARPGRLPARQVAAATASPRTCFEALAGDRRHRRRGRLDAADPARARPRRPVGRPARWPGRSTSSRARSSTPGWSSGPSTAGATFRRQRVASVDDRRGRVVVDGTIRAPVVVGADGAHSVVRAHLGLPHRPPRARDPRLRADPAGPARHPGDPVRRPPAAGVRLGLRPRRRALQRRLRRAAARATARRPAVAGAAARPARAAAARLGRRRRRTGRATTCRCPAGAGTSPTGRLLLAGDAAGLINPMTGEGIYYAVATGIAAGRAAVARGPRRPATPPARCTGAPSAACSAATSSTPGSPRGWPSTRVIVDGGIRVGPPRPTGLRRAGRARAGRRPDLRPAGPRPGRRAGAARPSDRAQREGSTDADPVGPRRAAAAPLLPGRDHRRLRRRDRARRRAGRAAAAPVPRQRRRRVPAHRAAAASSTASSTASPPPTTCSSSTPSSSAPGRCRTRSRPPT